MTRKTPRNPIDGIVAFDCFSWVVENSFRGYIAMTGPFRTAAALSARFQPAVIVEDGDTTFDEEIEHLGRVLGKPIVKIVPDTAYNQGVRVWLSISIDHFCPLIPKLDERILIAAILNDTMSYEGYFGPTNVETFISGARAADIILPISDYSRRGYETVRKKISGLKAQTFVPYTVAHHFNNFVPELITYASRSPQTSVSLHSLFKRKNLRRTLSIAGYYSKRHVHIGGIYDEDPQILSDGASAGFLVWLSQVNDLQMNEILLASDTFICSSFEEGFSIPPMEAMILGVPRIVLSDIPVHREVYGGFKVNFVSPNLNDPFPAKEDLITIDDVDRYEIFRRHSFAQAIKPFQRFLDDL